MKKLLAYISLLLLTALPAYAFQDDEVIVVPNVTIGDTVYEYETEVTNEAENNTAPVAPPVYKKRTFSSDFKEKYKDSDFDYTVKKAPDNFFTRFLAQVREFFHNLFNRNSNPSAPNISLLLVIFKILGILILTTIVVLVVISLVRGNLSGFFGKKSAKLLSEDTAIEDLLETDFAMLIQKTENENNHRLAVRYYYLWLLQHLANRGLIKWNTDKTNTDYYYEINDTHIRTDFKYLSYIYDYIWYGEFDLDNTAYLKAKNAFRKTLNTI